MSDRIEGAAESLVDMLRSAARSQDHALVNNARRIIETMERLIATVESGYHVNSLGVLQGQAADLDRLCALRSQTVETLAATERTFEQMGVTVPPARTRKGAPRRAEPIRQACAERSHPFGCGCSEEAL